MTTNTRDIHVTVWNEYRHERQDEGVAAIYPEGIHATLAAALRKAELTVRTATLDEPEHGLSVDVLSAKDVLVWWGHMAHGEVSDDAVARVQQRVLDGMGLIVLHSGHFSKIFRTLMGTNCDLRWRESNDHERLWVTAPGHPITEGLGDYIEIEHEETYGEHFDVPPPETLVFVSWFSGGEVVPCGWWFTRGLRRNFLFRPRHRKPPTYHHSEGSRGIMYAVRWAAPTPGAPRTAGNEQAPELKWSSGR